MTSSLTLSKQIIKIKFNINNNKIKININNILNLVTSKDKGNSLQKYEGVKNPICNNCIHLVEYTHDYPWDQSPDNKLKGCSKFIIKSLVSGVKKYEFASVCREDKNKCGQEGRFFEEK